jgi:hypothetical protein
MQFGHTPLRRGMQFGQTPVKRGMQFEQNPLRSSMQFGYFFFSIQFGCSPKNDLKINKHQKNAK